MGSNTYLYLKTNTNTITNKYLYLYLYLNASEKKYLYLYLYLNKVFGFDANTFQILFKYFLDIYSFSQPNVYFSLEMVHLKKNYKYQSNTYYSIVF